MMDKKKKKEVKKGAPQLCSGVELFIEDRSISHMYFRWVVFSFAHSLQAQVLVYHSMLQSMC